MWLGVSTMYLSWLLNIHCVILFTVKCCIFSQHFSVCFCFLDEAIRSSCIFSLWLPLTPSILTLWARWGAQYGNTDGYNVGKLVGTLWASLWAQCGNACGHFVSMLVGSLWARLQANCGHACRHILGTLVGTFWARFAVLLEQSQQ